KNKFIDIEGAEQNPFYDFKKTFDSDSVNDATIIRTVRNEAGIKGNLLKLFYNGYYAVRHYHAQYKHLPADTLNLSRYPDEEGNEHYVRGRMALALDSLVELNGWAEVIVPDGNYRIEGSIRSKWFTASLKQMLYKPAFLTQAYRGRHDYWDNWLA